MWHDAAGQPHAITQAEGGEQGDPLMPAFFWGQQAALAEVQARLAPSELLLAFLDDVDVIARPDRIRPIFDMLSDALRRDAHIRLNAGKARVWNAPGVSGLASGADLGVPVGSCSPRSNHVLRLLPPNSTVDFALAHDVAMGDCLSALLQAGPLPPSTLDLARAPLRLGGLGLRSAVAVASAAHWASALVEARLRKERAYPELLRAHCRLVVLALEVGGRWSEEAASFVRFLARARAREVPLPFRSATAAAFVARWLAFLSFAAPLSFAESLLEGRVSSGRSWAALGPTSASSSPTRLARRPSSPVFGDGSWRPRLLSAGPRHPLTVLVS